MLPREAMDIRVTKEMGLEAILVRGAIAKQASKGHGIGMQRIRNGQAMLTLIVGISPLLAPGFSGEGVSGVLVWASAAAENWRKEGLIEARLLETCS